MIYLTVGLLVLASYLLGAVPNALLIGKWVKGIDIRQHGSGNVGATNALRTLGVGPSLLIFALDMAKGALPVLAGWQLTGSLLTGTICGLAAVAGHNWSVFIGFRGGRGVSTALGALYVLSLPSALIVTCIGIGVIALSRYVSLGSLTGAVVAPFITFAFFWGGAPVEPVIYCLVGGTVVVVRHRANVRRLLAGTENRLGTKMEGTR